MERGRADRGKKRQAADDAGRVERRGERVARNLDLFVSLALDKPIKMSPRTLSAKLLIHTLKSAARGLIKQNLFCCHSA